MSDGGFRYLTMRSFARPQRQVLRDANNPSTTALSSTINPTTVGQSTTLSVSITPATATGSVTFNEGATLLGSGTLTAGTATLLTSFATAGNHILSASYGGDAAHAASTSALNVGNPQLAFEFAQMPNSGVGLARLEFIINNNIGVHPRAILDYPNIDLDLKKAVESVARGHASPRAFYVDKLTEGIATIAAAFWPKPVIVRLSDFKSNEYRKLIGGSRYEPEEENPMLGFRGASRYISEAFGEAFAMECEALVRVRGEMGLTNVEVMVPFVRTLGQAKTVVDMLAKRGLRRASDGGQDGLKIIMMCEVPSNAILAEQFLDYFDGMSIGSNDLTQLTLGLDRDSGLELLAKDFDERDPAVKAMISRSIAACLAKGKYVGICGQGPSDHPDFADWLADEGIASMSLNPDSVVATWQRLAGR